MADIHDELCTSYAALALYDGEAEITSEQLKTLIEATGNEVEAYWPTLFASYLAKAGIEDLILAVGSAPSGGGGGGGGEGGGAAAEAAVEEKKEEEEEEVDMGGGMDMFGGGEGGDY
ncbi:60s acidic ribosomal protein-domain-containing protein [Tribonema minus]|uniref:60s acidic ribosomal protein-domain-containing protein n=1 Tax=Tribonema minus TaxID=303371 RepID=A0A835YXP2_9STRA|nr:60s acidic ribosomal protein-domain-containing protein [Tribonema minus]|eukprot:TRINITY_DN389_c0_g2_i2.p1 TRINITY_DN389_c0_g2~~TRINITY_DN389_c0_g2_i2.p1  ORF type:complete len:117 (-),score=57.88 TRINITY_DN389_c0_g2_i2:89-439(-)